MKYSILENRLRFNPVVFKFGASKDTESTNEANLRMTELTNQSNRDIADSTNAINRMIQSEVNATNISMNDANNALQIQLQKEMNEYNSLASQLERAEEAGVNPNAVISRLGGNVQTTLPSTQAGHADASRNEIGTPNVAPHFENPYMERMAVLDQMRGSINDFFARENVSAQTDLTKAQAQNQYTVNKYEDDLRSLGISMSRANLVKTFQEAQLIGSQIEVNKGRITEMNANVSAMNAKTYSQWQDNVFNKEKHDSTISAILANPQKFGLPAGYKCDKDTATALYYSGVIDAGVAFSQEKVNYYKNLVSKADVGRINAVTGLVSQQSAREKLEYGLRQKYGDATELQNYFHRVAEGEEINSRTNRNYQDFRHESWKDNNLYGDYLLRSLGLNNAYTESKITNTDIDSGKKAAETAKTVVDTAEGLTNFINPFK